MQPGQPVCLFLCGDVMTGRGIDQILPHPVDPVLYEPSVRDAREYVRLAEQAHGPIPRSVDFEYVWGEALTELQRAAPDARVINLETSITTSEDHCRGKEVLYRMHPENVGCLTAAHIDCCCLANNHVLDWGRSGLDDTLRTLDRAGISHAGAGASAQEAEKPVTIEVSGKVRVLVFAFGSVTSGIPEDWCATPTRSGVNLLENLSEACARRIGGRIRDLKEPGDIIVASIHWGSNWGYEIPRAQRRFAHQLIEHGVDIVHGHSSHHVRPIEVYRDRLVLYGCGDFVTDYEGIGGYEQYRGDLGLMHLVKVDSLDGRLVEARLVPMRSNRFRLKRTTPTDTTWLCELLNRLGMMTGTQVHLEPDGSLSLRW
jgi:poly-gamma-glutamate synthesis protein (capsule biosynthesis protein)